MEHAFYKVLRFEQLGTYTLRLTFDDGTSQLIDFELVLRGKLFGPLRDPELFEQVRIDPDFHTLVWPNDADFDPADLHDWPEVREDFIRRRAQWRE